MARFVIPRMLPYYGCKADLSDEIIAEIPSDHRMWFELCGGSLAVTLGKKPCAHEYVNDLYGFVVNVARVLADEVMARELYGTLNRLLLCEELFDEAKARLACSTGDQSLSVRRAADFLFVAWAGRSGITGTKLTNAHFSPRYTSSGGSRGDLWAEVVASVPDWHRRLARVNVLQRDCVALASSIDDEPTTVIYCDPPYIRDGETRTSSTKYVHEFSARDHVRLARALGRFKRARVIVSYYDHAWLYRLSPGWTVRRLDATKRLPTGNRRGSERESAPEVLLINGPSLVEGASLFAQVGVGDEKARMDAAGGVGSRVDVCG